MSEMPASVSRQPDRLPLPAVEVDEENRIIEGQHTPEQPRGMSYPAVTSAAERETGEIRHIVAMTAYRRRLTDAQRVILGLRIEPDVVERARRRQWDAGRASGDPLGQLAAQLSVRWSRRAGAPVSVPASRAATYLATV